MRIIKLSLIAIYSFLSIVAFAQPDLSDLKKDKDSDYNPESITLNVLANQLIGVDDDFELNALSSGYNINFHFNKRFGESRFSWSPGVGFNVRNYYSNVNLWQGDSTSSVTVFPDSVDYSKNRLGLYGLNIPIEFRYYSKPNEKDNFWSIALGVTGEWVYTVETKTRTGDLLSVFRGRDDLQEVNALQYGAHFRVSYGKIGFYAYYGLNELFSEDGPQGLVPWSAGIRLLSF